MFIKWRVYERQIRGKKIGDKKEGGVDYGGAKGEKDHRQRPSRN